MIGSSEQKGESTSSFREMPLEEWMFMDSKVDMTGGVAFGEVIALGTWLAHLRKRRHGR